MLSISDFKREEKRDKGREGLGYTVMDSFSFVHVKPAILTCGLMLLSD